MREVSVFYSFDDREFFDRDDCLEYERDMLNMIKKLNYKYSFFDKNMNIYMPPVNSEDVEDWINWFSGACDECEYIHRDENLEYGEEQFIREELGYCILNEDFKNEVGWFKYDTRRDEWVKVEDN